MFATWLLCVCPFFFDVCQDLPTLALVALCEVKAFTELIEGVQRIQGFDDNTKYSDNKKALHTLMVFCTQK